MDGGGILFGMAGVGIPFGMLGALVVVVIMVCVGGGVTLAAVPSSAVVRFGDVVAWELAVFCCMH